MKTKLFRIAQCAIITLIFALSACNKEPEAINYASDEDIAVVMLPPDRKTKGRDRSWAISPKIPMGISTIATFFTIWPDSDIDPPTGGYFRGLQDAPNLTYVTHQLDTHISFFMFTLTQWENAPRNFTFELDSARIVKHKMKTYNVIKFYKKNNQWAVECLISTDNYEDAKSVCAELRAKHLKEAEAFYGKKEHEAINHASEKETNASTVENAMSACDIITDALKTATQANYECVISHYHEFGFKTGDKPLEISNYILPDEKKRDFLVFLRDLLTSEYKPILVPERLDTDPPPVDMAQFAFFVIRDKITQKQFFTLKCYQTSVNNRPTEILNIF